jgi:hypothetical protein
MASRNSLARRNRRLRARAAGLADGVGEHLRHHRLCTWFIWRSSSGLERGLRERAPNVLLRPGGRLGIRDVIAEDTISPAQRAEAEQRTGCLAWPAAGFRDIGTRERIGQHHGRWRDVILIERRSHAI